MTQTPDEWLSTPADPEALIEDVGDGIGITSPAAPLAGDVRQHDQRIRAVVIRACTSCGGKRAQAEDGRWLCDEGHDDGDVIDLGLINARFENPLKQKAWDLVGKHRASSRIKKANARLP